MSSQNFCQFIFFNYLIPWIVGHITLTFPEARFPPLDFLDSFRTSDPCGVPKSTRSLITNFEIDKPYNLTWKMQYPHQGGFRLELFDQTGTLVETILPLVLNDNNGNSTNEFAGSDDQTMESHLVTFKHACQNCTLRMERQALEWGKIYRFHSCAEINILENLLSDAQCSGKGVLMSDQTCQCQKDFSGDNCQYEDDCTIDLDCANNGKCVSNGIMPNRRSCFCQYGYYGMNCKNKSYMKGDEENDEKGRKCFAYETIESNENTELKYGMFNENCYKKFELNTDDFLYTRMIKNELEIILDYKTETWLSVGWRPLEIPTTCRSFPDLNADAIDHFDNSQRLSGYLPTAYNADLHPMDCIDIIMASIKENNLLHISDMYTRDRSTPLDDAYFDGEMSISAAYGYQTAKGRSIVMFRRMIREIEPTDHPLGPGTIFLIWAKGQTRDAYNHLAKSAIEKSQIKNHHFYEDDQWKYHGGKNRGFGKLELISTKELNKFKSHPMHPLERPTTTTGTTTASTTEMSFETSFVDESEINDTTKNNNTSSKVNNEDETVTRTNNDSDPIQFSNSTEIPSTSTKTSPSITSTEDCVESENCSTDTGVYHKPINSIALLILSFAMIFI